MIFRSMELGARAIGGAELTEMDPSLAAYFNVDRGVLTLHVVPETPADRAGLQAGDVIVKAKDRPVYRVSDLRAIVASNPDGVKLEVLRKGQKQTLELKTIMR
jgi:S1-C subfamily serine protease